MNGSIKLNWWLYDKVLTVAAYVLLAIAVFFNQDLFLSLVFVAIVLIMLYCAMIFRACSYKWQPYKYKVNVRKSHPLWSNLQMLLLLVAFTVANMCAAWGKNISSTAAMLFCVTMCMLAQLCSWRNDQWRTMHSSTIGKKF